MAPSRIPPAAFEPLPPDLDVAALVESTDNFKYAARIHCDAIDLQGTANFEKLVLLHVIVSGKPLVIEGYNSERRLPSSLFSTKWLRETMGTKGVV